MSTLLALEGVVVVSVMANLLQGALAPTLPSQILVVLCAAGPGLELLCLEHYASSELDFE